MARTDIKCDSCPHVDCLNNYPQGIPEHCWASQCPAVLEETKAGYMTPEAHQLFAAAGKVATKGYRKWPRIQEAIEFCKELGVTRVGLASCVALFSELRDVARLFKGAGFEVVAAACQVGRVPPTQRGLPEEFATYQGVYCNPIAQAELLNREGTQINFVLGLCLGHDILFHQHSRAPASTLIVKDRVTGNNPSAALHSFFHRRSLWKEYIGQDIL